MVERLALLNGPKTVTLPWPDYPVIDAEEVCAATRVVMSGSLSEVGRGPFITRMEDALAAFFGVPFVMSCASGTGALHCALFAVGVMPGDEVLIANHNWISAIMAVFHAGAIPVLCDVKAGTYSLDPAEIARKVTPRTKAVIATHLWGLPADMAGILTAARAHGLAVIEDVSHAHGGKYRGEYLGTIGDVGCFSLQGSKAMVAGEGGFLLTKNEYYLERAIIPGQHTRRLASAKMSDDLALFHVAGGMWNYRMHPVAAAIATTQLAKLPAMNAARRANFERLVTGTADIPFLSWPREEPDCERGWYGAPAVYDTARAGGVDRDRFVHACQAEGMAMYGMGYTDWCEAPIMQDLDLLGQLVVTRHTNHAAFTPQPASAFPNTRALLTGMLTFQIPAVDAAPVIDQEIAALHKIADQMAVLREQPVEV